MNVDSSEEFTCIELCAGYAGIHLGLQRVIRNLRVIAYSEIELFAIQNLVAKMENGLLDVAPIWTNLKTFPSNNFRGRVSIITGGYPCQPFSAAGKRQGADDPRHLWPYIREIVRTVRPLFVFFENVRGHVSLGLSTVLSDLAEDGYECRWGIFSAGECWINQSLTLKDREWVCQGCGEVVDRDLNAAQNILLFGAKQIGQGLPKSTLSEKRRTKALR